MNPHPLSFFGGLQGSRELAERAGAARSLLIINDVLTPTLWPTLHGHPSWQGGPP